MQWSTVAYLATLTAVDLLRNLTQNNTSLLRGRICSKWGVADSAIYNFCGAHGYSMYPSLVRPRTGKAHTTNLFKGADADKYLANMEKSENTIKLEERGMLKSPFHFAP